MLFCFSDERSWKDAAIMSERPDVTWAPPLTGSVIWGGSLDVPSLVKW